ncbi:hypothetical protein [Mycobacterium sp. Z3061]|uniref:hypothetical protein n=1 Tax=Mycobacterium sp. Z3061 TaxID=3073562 RepID=UPI002872CED1|nr:hypothetical protein [Mycobacterium sp. Z3061]
MTQLTATCTSCRESADEQDRSCSGCRAERACTELTENVTAALEIFLDAVYSPHSGPVYYRRSPAFEKDAPELAEIATACEQVTAGVKRLIGLALGRDVEMIAGPWHDRNDPYEGWHACLDWRG